MGNKDMMPRSHSEAKKLKSKFYFTGNKCVGGHVSKRYTSTGQCVQCVKERTKKQVDSGYFRSLYKNEEYRQANIKRCKEYKLKNKERFRESLRGWVKRNKFKSREIKRNYKYRRRAKTSSGVSTKALIEWKKQQRKICYWCNKKCEECYHVDHYVPLSKGGKHELDNLVISCPTCNIRKSSKDPYEWAQEVGRLF